MPSTLNPVRQIIDSLIAHLKQVSENTLLGYSATGQRFTPEARSVSVSETQFDIAPSNSHLSFADVQLHIEVVL